jgi:hypothetical protein
MKPTKTTNNLHFEDLSPERFEDLIRDIFYNEKKWLELYPYGKKGKDDGIDILAIEDNNGIKMTWAVQCKRYQKIQKNDLKEIIDKIKTNNIDTLPDILLLAFACDISKENKDYLDNYAETNGINKVIIWTSSFIESKLYNDLPELLYKYFDINLSKKKNEKAKSISDKIKKRDKLRKEFYKPFDPYKPYSGTNKFIYEDIILRAVNEEDGSFIKNNFGLKNQFGWYSGFKVEPYNIIDEGFEVIFEVNDVLINKTDDSWFLFDKKLDNNNDFIKLKVFGIGLIDYVNILETDFNNDECRPFFYCEFHGINGPFKEIFYQLTDKKFNNYRLNNEKRIYIK